MSAAAVDIRRLEVLEAVIDRGRQTFIEVGQALLAIRDEKLYAAKHDTFEDYCRARWGFERAHAYRLIDGAKVAALLSPIGDTPANEAQARELVPLLHDEASLVETFRELRTEYGDGVTAAKVKRLVGRRLGREERDARARAERAEKSAEAQRRLLESRHAEIEILGRPVRGVCRWPEPGERFGDLSGVPVLTRTEGALISSAECSLINSDIRDGWPGNPDAFDVEQGAPTRAFGWHESKILLPTGTWGVVEFVFGRDETTLRRYWHWDWIEGRDILGVAIPGLIQARELAGVLDALDGSRAPTKDYWSIWGRHWCDAGQLRDALSTGLALVNAALESEQLDLDEPAVVFEIGESLEIGRRSYGTPKGMRDSEHAGWKRFGDWLVSREEQEA